MQFEKILISSQSYILCHQLLEENPKLAQTIEQSSTIDQFKHNLYNWVFQKLKDNPDALEYYLHNTAQVDHTKIRWQDYATIRILDYIQYGKITEDAECYDPFSLLWWAAKFGTGGATPDFFEDMFFLFAQFSGKNTFELPSHQQVLKWMDRHPSGLDESIIKIRQYNKDRILQKIIEFLDLGEIQDKRFFFEKNLTPSQKWERALSWWQDPLFHLRFAIRTPEHLNLMLGNSLHPSVIHTLQQAHQKGIPFFINPYYLSLLNVDIPPKMIGADQVIRDYMLYNQELVDTFGHIKAWEKEDNISPNKPNTAGWLLPSGNNVHRRYPDVAILIPDGLGRTCGGLCSLCQRMYEFQQGSMNFHLEKERNIQTWPIKLNACLQYFEQDPQLRDILITGGDALMLSDNNLEELLDAVYKMAYSKQQANLTRPNGEKYAEIVRIRLGTRLPVYLPQRITPNLEKILTQFREKAQKIGIQQFIIQTHFATAMEVTPESKKAISHFIQAGWLVSNQHVFTSAASKRGHNAKLRKILNQIGVIPYYTFTVKGYAENRYHFTPNSRTVQEQTEEKILGKIPIALHPILRKFIEHPHDIFSQIEKVQQQANIPFLATDRNVINLPGIGKSMTFRTIGITYNGCRVLEFDYDNTRSHSPIIEKLGKIRIIESKSIPQYLRELKQSGENIEEYQSIYGYSIGQTDLRVPTFEYPLYNFVPTEIISNFDYSLLEKKC